MTAQTQPSAVEALRAADDVAEMIRLRDTRTPSLNQLRAWEAALRALAASQSARGDAAPAGDAVRALAIRAHALEIRLPDGQYRDELRTIRQDLDALAAAPAPAVREAVAGDAVDDTARLDWMEAQSAPALGWIARESTTGRGYRLHQTAGKSYGSVRAAIDAARTKDTHP